MYIQSQKLTKVILNGTMRKLKEQNQMLFPRLVFLPVPCQCTVKSVCFEQPEVWIYWNSSKDVYSRYNY